MTEATMSEKQRVALALMENLVLNEGGDECEIVRVGNAYQWTNDEGDVARIAWEEPEQP